MECHGVQPRQPGTTVRVHGVPWSPATPHVRMHMCTFSICQRYSASDMHSFTRLRRFGFSRAAAALSLSLICLLTAQNIHNHTGWPLSRQREIPWRFPDSSRHSSAALGMLSVTHIMPVLVLLSLVGVGMQQHMFSRQVLTLPLQYPIKADLHTYYSTQWLCQLLCLRKPDPCN